LETITEQQLLALIDSTTRMTASTESWCSSSSEAHQREEDPNAIDPDKDVDGFHPVNVGRLMIGGRGQIPALYARRYSGVDRAFRRRTKGAEVVVVVGPTSSGNRSP